MKKVTNGENTTETKDDVNNLEKWTFIFYNPKNGRLQNKQIKHFENGYIYYIFIHHESQGHCIFHLALWRQKPTKSTIIKSNQHYQVMQDSTPHAGFIILHVS